MTPTRIFLHYLERLESLLKKAQLFDPGVGDKRLHADMFSLLQQVKIAIGFTLRTTCPMAGRESVAYSAENQHETFESVYAELAATISSLTAIPDDAFRQAPL